MREKRRWLGAFNFNPFLYPKYTEEEGRRLQFKSVLESFINFFAVYLANSEYSV